MPSELKTFMSGIFSLRPCVIQNRAKSAPIKGDASGCYNFLRLKTAS